MKVSLRARAGYALAAVSVLLSACASPPQKSVQLSPGSVAANTGRVGVAMSPLPKADTHLPGAGCLLCIAAASVANASLTAHTKTLPYEDLPKLKSEVAELMRKKGAEVVVIPDDLDVKALPDNAVTGENLARKDFSSLQKKHNIEKLLVIDIASLGMLRTYSSYVPTSDPKAYMQGTGYMVNLKNNSYEWYMPLNITKSSDGKWDEPPKFPGLTNAYFQVLEMGKDSFLKPFGD